MKRLMAAVLFSTTLLGGCASMGNGGNNIDMAGMTNEQATEALVTALSDQKYQVKRVSGQALMVEYDNSHFMMQPKLTDNALDRIVIAKYYVLHPELAQTPELLLLIGQLNQRMDFAKFVLIEEGRGVEVRGAATFVDTISVEELTRFMDWTDAGLRALREAFPQATPVAKEVRFGG
ncbi:YbjN domain-containing protein [Marinobacter hydrocarbonoclasticus]|nr:YbjN domain-containing protein [Marinobacter nauticus]